MSDLEAIEDIYETSEHPAGKPCSSAQARWRRRYRQALRARQEELRAFNPGKHKPPVVSLAKINLPD